MAVICRAVCAVELLLCLFVCFNHRLFTPASTPREWILGQSCSDFGEVHAGYVSVAGTDIIAWTSVSGYFKSEYVCLFVSITGYSLLRAPPREWIFLRAWPFVLPPQGQSCSDFGEVHAGHHGMYL